MTPSSLPPASVEAPSWSPRRWTATIAGLFLSQVALVVYLGQRPSTAALEKRETITYRIEPALPLGTEGKAGTEEDPTLFALANRHGFSGGTWLEVRPLSYDLAQWQEPPQWLGLAIEELGQTFAAYVQESRLDTLVKGEEKSFFDLGAGLVALPGTTSRLQVQFSGDLELAPGQVLPVLEPWPSPVPLTNSVVEAGVGSGGEVFATRLVGRSGLAEADRKALEWVENLRFASEPERPGLFSLPLRWGHVIFQWHSVPLTNAASGLTVAH